MSTFPDQKLIFIRYYESIFSYSEPLSNSLHLHITENSKTFFYVLLAVGSAIVPSTPYTVTSGTPPGKYGFDLNFTIVQPEIQNRPKHILHSHY